MGRDAVGWRWVGNLFRLLTVGLLAMSGCPDGASPRDADPVGTTGGMPSGSSGEDDGSSGSDTEPGVEDVCDELSVGAARMRLLTRYEYDNTIEDLLGDDSAHAQSFPPENQSTAFENNAEDHKVNKDSVRRYMDTAEAVAANAVADLSSWMPCDPAIDGAAACAETFIEQVGRRAFRRPLTGEEQALFWELFTEEEAGHGFDSAVATVLQAMLQSPQFLYRIEMVPNDAEVGDVVEVGPYEMATRLSYFLAATTPDDALLDAAEAGELETPEQIEAQARRLLETDAARRAVRHFHRQWLSLSALESVNKDPEAFEDLDLTTAADDWSLSVQDFVEHVVFDGEGTFAELMSLNRVFMPDDMAAFYKAEPVGNGQGYTLPGDRAGLLTQPALMALYAYPDRSSPVARGVFVRERILCQTLPPPPDNADIEPPDPDPNATTREKFSQHTEDAACAGCHALIDPIGFTFEHYDAVGRFRHRENELYIDASGEVIDVMDPDLEGPVADAVELAEKLAVSEDFEACASRQWLTFALGRIPDVEADQCTLETAQAAAASGDIKELLVGITVSDAFRYRVVDGGEG